MSSPERELPVEDLTVRFVLDGIYYALKNNVREDLTREAYREMLQDSLIRWFPDVEIIENPPEEA